MMAAALAPALNGCVTLEPAQAADTCNAAPAQGYLGRTASSAVGAELLRLTRSRELRWVAPEMMVTADYKFGRLTVAYDGAMRITRIWCS